MRLNMPSGKWRPFCPDLSVLTHWGVNKMVAILRTAILVVDQYCNRQCQVVIHFLGRCWRPLTSHGHIEVRNVLQHYNDAILSTMTSQITSLTIIYSTVYQSGRSPKVAALFLLQTLVEIKYDYFNCIIQSKWNKIILESNIIMII